MNLQRYWNPEITLGNILLIVSLAIGGSMAWLDFNIKVERIDVRLAVVERALPQLVDLTVAIGKHHIAEARTEERLSNVIIRMNRYRDRLERIETLQKEQKK